ncbi:hypothetical protein YC2023_024644 [Brassica napus]
MATKVDEEAGVNGAGGTIKEEKIPLLKAQDFLDIENNNLYTRNALKATDYSYILCKCHYDVLVFGAVVMFDQNVVNCYHMFVSAVII